MNSPAVSIAPKASTVIVVCSGGPMAVLPDPPVQPASRTSEVTTVARQAVENGKGMTDLGILP